MLITGRNYVCVFTINTADNVCEVRVLCRAGWTTRHVTGGLFFFYFDMNAAVPPRYE